MPWEDTACPSCEETNWVDLGDFNDLSQEDVTGCTCWHCKEMFSLSPDLRFDGEDLCFGDGRQKPGYG